KKKRAPVCLHVVADEREQSVREALRLFARRGEGERTIDEVQGARALPQRFAPAGKLDVRLLERSDRGGELLLEHDELSRRSAGVLGDARILALPREERGRLGGLGLRAPSRLAQLPLRRRQPREIVAVHFLRAVLERLHGFATRFALRETQERHF